jgi:fibronectin type 3 domain-containing protein
LLRGNAAGNYSTSIGLGNVTSYVDTQVSNGTTYYYSVYATNAGGNSSTAAEVSATPLAPPAAPTGVAAAPGNTKVTLYWIAATGAPSSYTVLRGTVSGTYGTILPSGSATTYVDSLVSNGITYYYVIRASNAGGNGPNSSQVSATPTSACVRYCPSTCSDLRPANLCGGTKCPVLNCAPPPAGGTP